MYPNMGGIGMPPPNMNLPPYSGPVGGGPYPNMSIPPSGNNFNMVGGGVPPQNIGPSFSIPENENQQIGGEPE